MLVSTVVSRRMMVPVLLLLRLLRLVRLVRCCGGLTMTPSTPLPGADTFYDTPENTTFVQVSLTSWRPS